MIWFIVGGVSHVQRLRNSDRIFFVTVNLRRRVTPLDAAGNLTSGGLYNYAYDAEGHQTSAAGVTYTYDGLGRRVEKSNGTLYWYGTGSQVLAETDLSGNNFNEYAYFGGRLI
ncbi:MAG TPA: hypothetical protein VGW37_02375, partial [Terriglobia bacterium]|nr:hypothetical protein [Terriglobia bacterium]